MVRALGSGKGNLMDGKIKIAAWMGIAAIMLLVSTVAWVWIVAQCVKLATAWGWLP